MMAGLGVEMLNVDRPGHLSLHTLLTQVTSLSECWSVACANAFSAETLTRFGRVLHDVAKLSEEHRYSQVYELVCEMESAAIALGRRKQGELNEQVVKYMGSCVSMLDTLCRRLMDDAQHQSDELSGDVVPLVTKAAKRVYFLDERQQSSQGISVDLKNHGYQVLSFRSTDDLSHAVKFREPTAIAVFLPSVELEGNDVKRRERVLVEQQELLQSVISYSQGRVPCIAIGESADGGVSRIAAAEAGANSYYAAPVDIAELGCELFSLQHAALPRKLKTLLMTDTYCAASKQISQVLQRAEFNVELAHSGGELVSKLVEGMEQPEPVDAVVIYDGGNEGMLRQSFALLRQDPVLESVPLFVITASKVRHSEHFHRLIQVGSMGHFNIDNFLHKDVSAQLLLKIQSNTLRYRRQQAKVAYAGKVERGTGMLTRAGFDWHCKDVLSLIEPLDQAPPHVIALKLVNTERFAEAVGISDDNLRSVVCHGLLGLLSSMDRVISSSADLHTLFLAQVDKPRLDALLTRFSEWFAHFSAQYSAGEDLTAVPGWSAVSDADLQGAIRNARAALDWQLSHRKQSHSSSEVAVVEKAHSPEEGASVVRLNNIHSINAGTEKDTTEQEADNWSSRVKNAIKKRCLNLVFQPIVSLDVDDRERYEVLLRLNESGEEILPGLFMKGIQDAALINYIDRWVITMALKELRQANRNRDRICVFFIKLTGHTIANRSFVPWLKKALEGSGVQPSQCVFELPEGVLLETFAIAKDAIRRIRDLGAEISISRFGNSPRSLGLLEYFDVDFVKLDQHITNPEGHADRAQVDALIEKAKARNVMVLAGFVEDTKSLMSVIQTGVGLVLGDFLQPPDALRQFDFTIDL